MIPPKPVTPHPFPDGGHCLRLGFLGRLVPQKNLVYLLEAFEHLVAGRAGACPEPVSWELHLFGDGPTKQELEFAAAARGLESRVHFHGAVPHDAVAGRNRPVPPLRLLLRYRRGNASPLWKSSHVAGRSSQRQLAPFRSS